MKTSWVMPCLMFVLAACGEVTSQQNLLEDSSLGTIESRLCSNISDPGIACIECGITSCGSNYRPSGYGCTGGCGECLAGSANSTSCEPILDRSGNPAYTYSACGRSVDGADGYFAYAYGENDYCNYVYPSPNNTNATAYYRIPTTAGSYITVCGIDTCPTGFVKIELIESSNCIGNYGATGNNATRCRN